MPSAAKPGDDRDPAGGDERRRVVADVLADDARRPRPRPPRRAGARRRPSRRRCPTFCRPKRVGDEHHRRWHGGDVVEAEQDREREDAHRVVDERQEQQAHAAEAVVDEQQLRGSQRSVSQPDAIVPMKLKTPITASAPDAATAVKPWSTAWAMKCWPIEPVRGRAADEERRREEPEVDRPDGPAHDAGIRRRRRRDRRLGSRRAAGARGRPGRRAARSATGMSSARAMPARTSAPAASRRYRQRRQEREEDQLARADAGAEDAGDEPAS